MKTIFKTLALIIIVSFVGCNRHNDPNLEDFKISTALSIFVKDGKVGVSSLVNQNYTVYTEYWIDGVKSTSEQLTALLPVGNYYRTSIDAKHNASTVYRKTNDEVVTYKFPRAPHSLNPDQQLYYYKNNLLQKMDTTAFGVIHAVDAAHNEVFAGFFGHERYSNYGYYLAPTKAFYWDGANQITVLPLPSTFFNGVSCIHKSGNTVYVGGKMDFPMYWKNTEIVRLNQKYGAINQIKTIGNDVYAVGFFNKNNYTKSNHTAAYWKNKTLVELEDNAVAYSIFLDGEDVYVAGATGRSDSEYKACYWKNGEKVMLEE